MQIQIQVLGVMVESKGKYDQAEVSYKDLGNGKVSSKKLFSFNNKEVYNLIKGARTGEIFTIEMTKNDKGYWDWIKANVTTNVSTTNTPSPDQPTSRATPSPKSTYETAEERAQRQVMIVRQSSASTAVQALKTDKKALTADEVITFAKKLEAYVMGLDTDIVPLDQLPAIEDDDDIPM